MPPSVYVIAGPNGAGKTTFAREFLPRYARCQNFVNADLIAQGISPFSPRLAELRAARVMLDQIALLSRQSRDFGFETTLAGLSYLNTFSHLRRRGYEIHLYYLWLPSVELALSRIRGRVREGGHDVPEAIVRRRFDRSLRNFLVRYANVVDSWILFDNASDSPAEIACGWGKKIDIIQEERYRELSKGYIQL